MVKKLTGKVVQLCSLAVICSGIYSELLKGGDLTCAMMVTALLTFYTGDKIR